MIRGSFGVQDAALDAALVMLTRRKAPKSDSVFIVKALPYPFNITLTRRSLARGPGHDVSRGSCAKRLRRSSTGTFNSVLIREDKS